MSEDNVTYEITIIAKRIEPAQRRPKKTQVFAKAFTLDPGKSGMYAVDDARHVDVLKNQALRAIREDHRTPPEKRIGAPPREPRR